MSTERIEYQLRKSDRKTMSIYVRNDGAVEVLAPTSMTDDAIEEQVQAKAYKIYSHLAEFEDLNSSARTREYVGGESFLYLGRNYRLHIQPEATGLDFKDNAFYGPKASQAKYRDFFIGFYKEKAKEKLPKRISEFASQMGLPYRKLRFMDLKTRWASCNEKGDLNFHWKVMMAPMNIVDYIIVHELAHLKHRNHTQAFWSLVDCVIPDYIERKNWLRINGAGMGL